MSLAMVLPSAIYPSSQLLPVIAKLGMVYADKAKVIGELYEYQIYFPKMSYP